MQIKDRWNIVNQQNAPSSEQNNRFLVGSLLFNVPRSGSTLSRLQLANKVYRLAWKLRWTSKQRFVVYLL